MYLTYGVRVFRFEQINFKTAYAPNRNVCRRYYNLRRYKLLYAKHLAKKIKHRTYRPNRFANCTIIDSALNKDNQ